MMTSLLNFELLQALYEVAQPLDLNVYLVGGGVRDILLGKPSYDTDYDCVVVGDAAELARKFVEKFNGRLVIFPKFQTAKIFLSDQFNGLNELDLVSSRSEKYLKPGGLPLVSLSNLEDDLLRRDFTVNILALSIAELIKNKASIIEKGLEEIRKLVIDQHAGQSDLAKGIIRILHNDSFIDDPTRIFRAARYLVRINGELDQATKEALFEAVAEGALLTVSIQRILHEFEIVFKEEDPIAILENLRDWTVLRNLFWIEPETEQRFLEGIMRLFSEGVSWRSIWLDVFKIGLLVCQPVNARDNLAMRLLISKKKLKRFVLDLEALELGRPDKIELPLLVWSWADPSYVDQRYKLAQLLSERLDRLEV